MANASTLTLESGQAVKGQIINQTDVLVTMDIQGMPKTFFLGEIAAIDGKTLEMSQDPDVQAVPEDNAAPPAPAVSKNVSIPYYNDEQDSLVRFMDRRNPAAVPVVPAAAPTPPKSLPAVQSPPEKDEEADSVPTPKTADKITGTNKNVIATPDGGIMVVTASKIIKYDKDLVLVREIDLKTDPIAGSK